MPVLTTLASPSRTHRWRCALIVLAISLATGSPVHAKARDYALDPVHTRLVFRVDHAGLSQAMGSFSAINGHLRFDPDNVASASVDLSIALATLDFGDADWRKAVLAGSFLAEKNHPMARFVSTRVEPGAAGAMRVFGQLELRGVRHEVVLDAQLNAIKRHPLTLKRSIGFSATGTLHRSDFGMTAWQSLIGDEVTLLIEVEAVRQSRPADEAPAPTDTPEETDHAPAQ